MDSAHLVTESDSVHRSQVMIIFLNHLSAPGIVLQNLLVMHAC
jgi:hypothetical protein